MDVLLHVLEGRFGELTPTVRASLAQVQRAEDLSRLTRPAVNCPTLQAFEDSLRHELFLSCGKPRPPRGDP
jgi:hypothetical protein